MDLLYQLSEKRVLAGMPVGILWPSPDERATVLGKVHSALELIAQYDPRRYQRLKRDAMAILAFGEVGAQGQWFQGARLITLQLDYLMRATTTPADIAATLVHEGTHAWLNRLGFRNTEDRRARIEAVCFRSSASFARKLPSPGRILEETERYLRLDPAFWSNAALHQREGDALRALGVPKWLVGLLLRVAKRRVA